MPLWRIWPERVPVQPAPRPADWFAAVANLGWATGSARVKDSIVATNCKFGGNLVEIEIDDEDESQKEKSTPLTADNYFDYIFGGTTDWTGVENYDGCTFLEASPLSE